MVVHQIKWSRSKERIIAVDEPVESPAAVAA
jgi:hypothetical protein